MVATVTLYQQCPDLEGRGEHQSSGKELCFAKNQTMAVGTWTTHSVGTDLGWDMPQQAACPLSASTQTARIEMRKPRNQSTWRDPESRRQLGVGIWKSPSTTGSLHVLSPLSHCSPCLLALLIITLFSHLVNVYSSFRYFDSSYVPLPTFLNPTRIQVQFFDISNQ